MHKTVFVLGSGFSKDIVGYPTLEQLSKEVRADLEKDRNDKYLSAFLTDKIPLAVRCNIEHLLTFLFQEYPWRSDKEKSLCKAGYYLITEIIEKIFSKYETENFKRALSNENALQLIKLWHKWESHVISFNYDTLIESFSVNAIRAKVKTESRSSGRLFKFLNSMTVQIQNDLPNLSEIKTPKIEWDSEKKDLVITLPNRDYDAEQVTGTLQAYESSAPGFPYGQISPDLDTLASIIRRLNDTIQLEDIYQIPIRNIIARTQTLFSHEKQATFKLIKLHGSVNWFSSFSANGGRELYYTPFGQRHEKDIEMNKKGLSTFIIPPVLDKSSFYLHDGVRVQWEQAKRILAEAKVIFFIGYSLPETDLSSRFLLQESLLSENCKLVVFVKENISDEKSKRRLNEMERRYLDLVNGNKDRCEFVNVDQGSSISDVMKRFL